MKSEALVVLLKDIEHEINMGTQCLEVLGMIKSLIMSDNHRPQLVDYAKKQVLISIARDIKKHNMTGSEFLSFANKRLIFHGLVSPNHTLEFDDNRDLLLHEIALLVK